MILKPIASCGITYLFVLDKKFVLDALKEKMEREGLI